MELVVQDFAPYDEGLAWRIHDAFYAERGIAAWTAGDIPYAATNNSAFARQNARLFCELVRELEARGEVRRDEPVWVLEVGSGHGAHALHFVDAVRHQCGEDGEELAPRLRYALSDCAQRSLDEATASPALRALVDEGVVAPMRFDLTDPAPLVLPGDPAPARGPRTTTAGARTKGRPEATRATRARRAPRSGPAPLVLVVLNYVACASRVKVLRRLDGSTYEKHARLSLPVADEAEARAVAEEVADVAEGGEVLPRRALLERLEATSAWAEVDLDAAFPAGTSHAAAARDALEALDDGEGATLSYPAPFLDLLARLRARLAPGGAYLVSDFGSAERGEVHGPDHERAPMRYGLSLAHDVDFPALEAFARREGMDVARTRGGLVELHTALIRPGRELGPWLEQAFDRTHARRAAGQELLDLTSAAAASFDAGRPGEAARLYAMALRLAPRSPNVIHRYAQAVLAADVRAASTLRALARRLRRGRRLDVAGKLEWDALLAGVWLRLGEPARARDLLLAALARGESAALHAALALAHEAAGDPRRAYESHVRALELDPASPSAARLVAYLAGERAAVTWSGGRARRARKEEENKNKNKNKSGNGR